MERTLVVRISRKGKENGVEDFTVTADERTTVLDLLERIHRQQDPSLMFRHSCHHGSCGTCACIINGDERLACMTTVGELEGDLVTVEPLAGMGLEGDLVVDPSVLFGEFPQDAGYLRPSDAHPKSVPPPEVERYERFENCIECGCCVSACPVTKDFTGPAALAMWNRERTKHPERTGEVLRAVDSPRGAWGCIRALECSRVCPTGVAPARHIQLLRNSLKPGKKR